MGTDTQKHATIHRTGLRRRPIGLFGGAALAVAGTAALIINLGAPAAFAAEAPVGLGAVASYSVLGGETVTNTGLTVLDGDLGTTPGSAITGFPPGIVGGTTRVEAAAADAKASLLVAYDDARSRATTASVAGDLVGQTLVGGVYTASGPLAVSGTLTLDAQGDPNAVFIFQAASTLITASSSRIALLDGASSCNVYWQVAESATLGTNSRFTGTIMALQSISVTTGTRVDGRALARNGQVSLQSNVFQSTTCVTAPIISTPTDTATPPGTGTPTDGGTGGPGTPTDGGTGGPGTPTDGGTGGPGTPTDGGPGTPGNGTPGTGTPTDNGGVLIVPTSTRGPNGGGNANGNSPDSLANSGADSAANGWIGVTALGLVIGGLGLAGVSLRRRENARTKA
ncbi:ice-binding family protein [Okibacterium fritillariae]|uniref:DUF3494 domain-containing protein n=1 Tax=Okibacterium fritillariae TaxID=123320 RepID=A0A1T5KVC4_9MICO|nr:ice-binding family protein [Okibacterium fritillariae]SKC67631.1 Protein of unknown function [Okibacterium fritillariae]